MQPSVHDHVTLVELLELQRPFAEVEPLLKGLIARLARQGVPALLSMQFYTEPGSRRLAAVITFASAPPMLEHTTMISSWPEFAQFSATVKLVEMRVHGKLTPEVRTWMEQFKGDISVHEQHVAGFVRPFAGG